jgi:hypothetical protein
MTITKSDTNVSTRRLRLCVRVGAAVDIVAGLPGCRTFRPDIQR